MSLRRRDWYRNKNLPADVMSLLVKPIIRIVAVLRLLPFRIGFGGDLPVGPIGVTHCPVFRIGCAQQEGSWSRSRRSVVERPSLRSRRPWHAHTGQMIQQIIAVGGDESA